MTDFKKITKKELEQIRHNRAVRQKLAYKSHIWFFLIYLGEHMTYPFAPAHYEIFKLTEDITKDYIVLTAFRAFGKTTLMRSYVTWAITGIQQKKFVLILCQTQAQAKLYLDDIKEILRSELLEKDIGPFRETKEKWGSTTIVIKKYRARITVASTEQSVRGITHGPHRPQLIICDDVEDSNSVRTVEGRDKIHRWLTREIIPIGNKGTKIIISGNVLHEDGLTMRLKKQIDNKEIDATYLSIPLLGSKGKIAWPGKYPTYQDIEKVKATLGSEEAFQMEYLLKPISSANAVVRLEWIQRYDKLPFLDSGNFRCAVIGTDLAISDKESANYTAMVSAFIFGYGYDQKIYVLPNIVNKRMDSPTAVKTTISLSKSLGVGVYPKILVEAVGYQLAFGQYLLEKNIPIEGINIHGWDKRARLALAAPFIQQGKILFPVRGAEDLIFQITGFGVERYDDLADAFSLIVLWIIEHLSEDDTDDPSVVKGPAVIGWPGGELPELAPGEGVLKPGIFGKVF